MKPLVDYRDRVAIVTGASSGIGAGLARGLARRGARVALVARRRERLEALAAEIASAGGTAWAVPCDIEQRAEVEATAKAVLERFGRVDILVNNAGRARHALFKDHDVDDIERLMRVNYFAVVYWIKAVLPALRARGEGWIVNLSSVAGRLGQPDESAYAATKFAVAGLSESLTYEFDPLGIQVLCVHPALVRTEMFDEATLARMPERVKRTFIEVEPFCEEVFSALARGAYELTVPRYVGLAYLMRVLAPRLLRRQMVQIRLPALPDLTS
jgi:short-subunit dehydrogenase